MSSSSAPAAERPGALDLAPERDALAAIAALLVREREALVVGDHDALAAVAAEKTAAVEALERLLAERLALARRETGCPDRRASWEAWIARQPTAVRAASGALLDEAARVRELNRLNGRLIEQRLAIFRQGLAVLASASGAALYDASGRILSASRTSEGIHV